MNQADWYEIIQAAKRRHSLEMKELRDRQQAEINHLNDAMCDAPPAEYFKASKMRSVNVNELTSSTDIYSLSA